MGSSICALIACAAMTCASSASELCRVTDGGTPFRGSLVKFNEDGQPVFDTNAGSVAVPLNGLITWGELRDTPDGTQVLLADGSVIVASDVALEGENLIVRASLFGEPEGLSIAGATSVPVSAVRAIVFRVPLRPDDRDALFRRLRSVTGFADQLWLANGDALAGTLTHLGRRKSGDRPGPASLTFKTETGEIELRPQNAQGKLLEKVQAVIFNPALVRKVDEHETTMLAGLSDGSRLSTTSIEPIGDRATFTLACGVKIQSHTDENIWRKINALQSFGPHVKYVSDLSPLDYRQTPMLGKKWPLGVDQSVSSGMLRAGRRLYVKGLGMHSRSRVMYKLAKPYSKFEAELAIDDSAGERGSVIFLAARHIDGRFRIVPDSKILVRGGDPPRSISIDLRGAAAVALFVEPADHGDVMDRANWLNARLIPAINDE